MPQVDVGKGQAERERPALGRGPTAAAAAAGVRARWSRRRAVGGPPTQARAPAAGIRLAGATNDVNIMDVRTGRWEKVVPLGEPPSPRAAHAAAAVGNMVVIQGGIGPAGLASEDLHVLDFTDFEKPRWHRCGAARRARCAGMRGRAGLRGGRGGRMEAAAAAASCAPARLSGAATRRRGVVLFMQGDGVWPRPLGAVCAHAGAGGQPLPGGGERGGRCPCSCLAGQQRAPLLLVVSPASAHQPTQEHDAL